jgi:hypothetical protein
MNRRLPTKNGNVNQTRCISVEVTYDNTYKMGWSRKGRREKINGEFDASVDK